MKISKTGLKLIKSHEGLRLRAYKCPAGVWTIGYGSTGPHVKPKSVITEAEAEELLDRDLDRYEAAVLRACSPAVPNQVEFDAMVSLCYNIGVRGFSKSSVVRQFKRGNKAAAANAFELWNKARNPRTGQLEVLPGLVRRRAEEKDLFLSTPKPRTVERETSSGKVVEVPEASVVPVEPKPLTRSREIIGGTVVGAGGAGQLISELTANDAVEIKKGTVELQKDAENSAFFQEMYLPEVASALTVMLSMFIIWKRFSDRSNGVR